ncbi:MAG: phosphodiester glycosidase family protein [Candidatus Eremiobacteraeota bacterium]|nr:phosphodiester glycosidase family protein [Candidatus Eremiobacteraeota bacterium]
MGEITLKPGLLLCVAALLVALLSGAARGAVSFDEYVIDGVWVKAVTVDLGDSTIKVSPQVCYGLPFSEEPFDSIIYRTRPLAAVNGTYFNMETSTPVGEITIDGVKLNSSATGTVLAVTRKRRAFFFSARNHRKIKRSDLEFTLGGGPRLLVKGKIPSSFGGEGFRDKHIFGSAVRTAVGLDNASARLTMAVSLTSVTLGRWAATLRSLGVSDAINLDGGGSTALFYRGVFHVKPTRPLSNILVVYDRPGGGGGSHRGD